MRARHLFKPLISLLLICALVPWNAAHAEEPAFSDISDSPYQEAIIWAAEKGIVNGTGSGKFSPDNEVTYPQFLSMYLSLFYPEVYAGRDTSLGWAESLAAAAADAGIITYHDAAHNPDCTWVLAAEMILDAANLQVYDRALWGESNTLVYETLNIPQTNLMVSAKAYHLMDGIEVTNWKSVPTREETVQMLYQASEVDHQKDIPEIVKTFPVEFDGSGEMTVGTVYKALLDVPKEYREAFAEKGWKMYVSKTDISTRHPDYQNFAEKAAGLTDPERHEIHVNAASPDDSNTVRHEMGHFVMLEVVKKPLPQSIFQDEKEQAKDFFQRNYSGTSADELLAETFSYIAGNQNDEESLQKLQAAIPKTCSFVMENYF